MSCVRSTPPCVSSSACDGHRARVLRLAHRSARALHQHKPFVIVIHGTRAFRDRVPGPAVTPGEMSTTVLGAWYASVLRWRRPAALFVNERTLLPLVMPLAPARTLLTRLPDALAELLSAQRLPAPMIDREHAEARDQRLAPTANRSLVGVMNEFAFLADVDRGGQADRHPARFPCAATALRQPEGPGRPGALQGLTSEATVEALETARGRWCRRGRGARDDGCGIIVA
jgi:hypothetical protein